MIIIHVSVQTKENTTNTFERLIREIQADVRKMPGCLKSEWYANPEASRQFVIYGEFDTNENFENYLNSPIVKRIGEDLIPLLNAPPEFKHFNAMILDEN